MFNVKIPVTDCSVVEIPVPSQPKLHKQWCLFDQADYIDFDREVKKIENKQKNLIDLRETGDQGSFEDYDLRSPEKRAIDTLFEDIPKIQSVGGFTHQELKPRYKKKRHTAENLEGVKHVFNAHVTAKTKIVRMTKHVSRQY